MAQTLQKNPIDLPSFGLGPHGVTKLALNHCEGPLDVRPAVIVFVEHVLVYDEESV